MPSIIANDFKKECLVKEELCKIADSFIYSHEQIVYCKERIELLLQCSDNCWKLEPDCLEDIMKNKTPLSER